MLSRLGKYEIVDLLGRGGMGEVHKARDPVIGRHVAIKTIPAEVGADPWLRQRFEREAQSAGSLNHPNIVTIYDFGEAAGRLFIVMELLEGRDLKDMIGSHEPMALGTMLSMMEQICEGLAFAHTQHVVHRDLKPANIHVLPDFKIKIMDFGLARPSTSNMTQVGALLGTPHYMSPEQVRGETADARSDVFALGVLFYELVAGQRPFDADSVHSVLLQVLNEQPEPLRQRVAGLPAGLAEVLERAMAKSPAQRYADAGEMREALRAVRAGLSPGEAKRLLVTLPGEEGAPTVPPVVETVMVAGPPAISMPPATPVPPVTRVPAATPVPAVTPRPAVTPVPASPSVPTWTPVPAAAVPVPAEPPRPGEPAPARVPGHAWSTGVFAGAVLLVVAAAVALLVAAIRRRAPAEPSAQPVAASSPSSPPSAIEPPRPTPAPSDPAAASASPEAPEPRAVRPRPSAKPEPPAARPAPPPTTLPAAAAAPVTVPAAATPNPAVAAAESLVRRTVKDLEKALERRDMKRLRDLAPRLSQTQEREIESSTWQEVSLSITGMEIQGDRALVRVLWGQRDASGTVSSSRRTLELERSVLGWKVSSIGR